VREYRPRGFNYRVPVRHSYPRPGLETSDIFPLQEIVAEQAYLPPEPVTTHLRRRGATAHIVDLGGHLGYFGAFILSRFPDASLVSFEPEPMHVQLLRHCIESNDLGPRWRLIEACADTADGTLLFTSRRSVGSHMVGAFGPEEGNDAIEVPARDVFPHIDGADLVKIDIEGGEWKILYDPRFAQAMPHALVLEYHSSPHCRGDNPKKAALERLEELGYTVELLAGDTLPVDEPFWGRGVLWAYLPGGSGRSGAATDIHLYDRAP
jgi:FkbM family methyltransferase